MRGWINHLKILGSSTGNSCLLASFIILLNIDSPSIYKLFLSLLVWIPSYAFLKQYVKTESLENKYEQISKQIKYSRTKSKEDLLYFFGDLSESRSKEIIETIASDEDKMVMLLMLKENHSKIFDCFHPLEKFFASFVGVLLAILFAIPAMISSHGYIVSIVISSASSSLLITKGSFNLSSFIWNMSIFGCTFTIYHYGF